MNIGRFLLSKRLELDLSREETSFSNGTLVSWENGYTIPSPKNRLKIAEEYNMPYSWWFDFIEVSDLYNEITELGHTLESFAHENKISLSQLRAWVKGNRLPSDRNMRKLTEAGITKASIAENYKGAARNAKWYNIYKELHRD